MAAPLPIAETITGKGTTLKAALAFVEDRAGADGVRRVLAACDPATRDLASKMILPGKKLPIDHLVALCEAIDSELGRGDLELCWEIGKAAADYEVKMLHKVFLKVAKLDYWLRIAGATWRFYYSAGTLVPSISGTSGSITLTDFYPISKAFCYRFGGWVHRVVEMSKLKNVQMRHSSCVLDGEPACVWTGTWSK